MNIEIGIKSDPIEYRYTFDWLFTLMNRLGIRNLQLGSFFEMYGLPDGYFRSLRDKAAESDVWIRSCFTAHRELGGFFVDDLEMQKVAFESYSRFLEVGALVGAESVGSNPGAIMRDRMAGKQDGVNRYLSAMELLSKRAAGLGLKALTVEPMSSLAEPPSTPAEIVGFMEHLGDYHHAHPDDTVPVYLCGDVSHGIADRDGRILHTHLELFECGIPWTWEFHLKNTDIRYESTFGFGDEERRSGIVELSAIREIVESNEARFPVQTLVAYLEIGGPKLGRDYSDPLLEARLVESIEAIRRFFQV